jgi:hypothetical protein
MLAQIQVANSIQAIIIQVVLSMIFINYQCYINVANR